MSVRICALALLALAVAPGAFSQTTPEADYAARCAAPGVVKCVGFDNTTTDIVPNVNTWPDGAGTMRAALDTSIKASGNGSLRFDLPPPPTAGANIAGSWSPVTNDALGGKMFGQNSSFYVQFRQRFSPEMLTNQWSSYWKTAIFHYNQLTCAGIELTTHNYYGTNVAALYTDCGARGLYTNLADTAWTDSTPLLMQQGKYNCAYGNLNTTDCFYFPANTWVTFYYHVQVGTWGQPNSTIEAWVALPGDTQYRQFIKIPNYSLNCDTDPCSAAPGVNQGFNNLTFTPYMTGLPTTSGSTAAHTWYDELVVSTQPIAVPGAPAGKQPMPPTNVVAH